MSVVEECKGSRFQDINPNSVGGMCLTGHGLYVAIICPLLRSLCSQLLPAFSPALSFFCNSSASHLIFSSSLYLTALLTLDSTIVLLLWATILLFCTQPFKCSAIKLLMLYIKSQHGFGLEGTFKGCLVQHSCNE